METKLVDVSDFTQLKCVCPYPSKDQSWNGHFPHFCSSCPTCRALFAIFGDWRELA